MLLKIKLKRSRFPFFVAIILGSAFLFFSFAGNLRASASNQTVNIATQQHLVGNLDSMMFLQCVQILPRFSNDPSCHVLNNVLYQCDF